MEDLSLRYDNSVRNSENTVVQFTYGDDSLNPEKMENNDRPVEFDRLRLHISQLFPCAEEPDLMQNQLLQKIEQSLREDRFQHLLPNGKSFLTEIETFFNNIVKKQTEATEACDSDAWIQQRTWNHCRFTDNKLCGARRSCRCNWCSKYQRTRNSDDSEGASNTSSGI